MSLHARLVTAVTVLAMVLLGVALSVVWLSVRFSQEEQLDVDLRNEAIEEAHEVAARGGRELTLDRENAPTDDSADVSKYGVIYGQDNEPIAWTSNLEGRVPPFTALQASKGTCFDFYVGREHVRGILVDVPRRSGSTVLIGASRVDLDADVGYLARALLIAFSAVVLLTAAIATRIVRRFTRDYKAIADVTRRVAEGDLTARVQSVRSDKEIAQQQRDFNSMIERLETLVSSHKRFIAHAAHELRSPLTTLYGELSLALRRSRTNEGYRFTIEQALDATRRLNLLAEDLLAMARLDAGSEEPWEDMRLGDVISNASRTISADLLAHRVTLNVDSTNVVVRTRGSELERMVRNLLENAARHSPPDGVVRVTVAEAETRLQLVVADEGPGIPPADRSRIFEPFWRGPDQQASGARGAGLGLAIARQIARAHGGDVELEDRSEARGARFRITLPLGVAASQEASAAIDEGSVPLHSKEVTTS